MTDKYKHLREKTPYRYVRNHRKPCCLGRNGKVKAFLTLDEALEIIAVDSSMTHYPCLVHAGKYHLTTKRQ